MANGFEIKIDLSLDVDVAAFVAATTAQLETAANRAMVKVARWLRTHSLRELGQQLGVKQEPLKKRFRVYPQRQKNQVTFWVGLEPIGIHRLGTPTVTRYGVKVNRKEYDKAFISPMKSSQLTVYKRRGRERLPIDQVKDSIDEQAMAVLERWESRAFTRFKEIFGQEAKAIVNGNA